MFNKLFWILLILIILLLNILLFLFIYLFCIVVSSILSLKNEGIFGKFKLFLSLKLFSFISISFFNFSVSSLIDKALILLFGINIFWFLLLSILIFWNIFFMSKCSLIILLSLLKLKSVGKPTKSILFLSKLKILLLVFIIFPIFSVLSFSISFICLTCSSFKILFVNKAP